MRCYNHNGRYYTRRDSARFDRLGLYSLGEIHFSRDGSLGMTLKRLIRESEAGLTHRELQDLLHVRVQVLLLEAVQHVLSLVDGGLGVGVLHHLLAQVNVQDGAFVGDVVETPVGLFDLLVDRGQFVAHLADLGLQW